MCLLQSKGVLVASGDPRFLGLSKRGSKAWWWRRIVVSGVSKKSYRFGWMLDSSRQATLRQTAGVRTMAVLRYSYVVTRMSSLPCVPRYYRSPVPARRLHLSGGGASDGLTTTC